MLQSIVDSPELLHCGKGRFQEFKMYHDGLRWIIELQRDENENQGLLSVQKTVTPGAT